MKRLIFIPIAIIALFLLSCWSWAVYHVSIGGQKLGSLTGPVLTYAKFPELIQETFHSIGSDLKIASNSYIKKDHSFQEVNNLDYDLYGLNSHWDHNEGTWMFDLSNLKDGQMLHEWRILPEDLDQLEFDDLMNSRPFHTLLLEDRSILLKFFSNLENNSFTGNYLMKLDSSSNILWINTELRFHHSTEMDADGNVWIPATDLISHRFEDQAVLYNERNAQVRNPDGVESYFRDDFITKVDPKTGEILYNKSVSRILIENGYKGLLLGSINTEFDPIHLNDIQPVLTDTEYWKKGDLFLSARNISTVLLYRPSENKVLWLKTGPFINQHDVDIISDSTISVFNNNQVHQYTPRAVRLEKGDQGFKNFVDVLSGNQVYIYDFKNDSSFVMFADHFNDLKINTSVEGLSEVLTNGDLFVEESDEGKIYILNKQAVKLQQSFNTVFKDKVHITNWFHIYEDVDW